MWVWSMDDVDDVDVSDQGHAKVRSRTYRTDAETADGSAALLVYPWADFCIALPQLPIPLIVLTLLTLHRDSS